MKEVTDAHIRTLITAESIISAILLLYLSGHVGAWNQSIETYQVYSITIFLSILMYVGCIFTLFRSIVLTFQSLCAKHGPERDDLYHIAYNLFLLVLVAVSIGIFVAFLSVVRQAIFSVPPIPIRVIVPWWLFLTLFLFLLIYLIVLLFRPKWISHAIDYVKN